jgi:hypothetical protein
MISSSSYDDGLGEHTIDGVVAVTECFDCLIQYGWPFRYRQTGTILHIDQILWWGLVADTVIGICFSVVVGMISYRLFDKRKYTKGRELHI